MYTYIITLSIFTALLIFCIIRIRRSDKPIAKVTKELMISVLFPIAGNIIIALSENRNLTAVGDILYFVGTNWMLIYLLRYVTVLCDYTYHKTKIERVIGLIMGIDTVSIMLNPVFIHVFDLEKIALEDGHIYYKYVSLWYHYIHLGLSYALTIASVIVLIVKAFKTAALYREKYIIIFSCIVVVGGAELYYLINPSVMEYAMVMYAALAALVYFFTIEYKPYVATYKMFNEVVTNVSEAILFFDNDNKCIYTNQKARELFRFKEDNLENPWDVVKEALGEDEYALQDIMMEGYFQCIKTFERDGDTLTFDIEYQKVSDKTGRLAGSFITARDRTEEQRRLDKERYQATHDSLTGLFNADYLYSRIEKEMIQNPDRRYVVVTSDIKGFKMVNDIYGTKTGDDILINIARQIEAHAGEGTIYGRVGGDKFGLIMYRDRFKESLFVEDVKQFSHVKPDLFYPIIIHVGVYEVTDRRIPVSVMFDRAFMALNTIKNDIQKRVAYYDANLREDMLWEQRIAGSIDLGLDAEQILPYLQAQVTKDGKIHGVEMLARWMHPTEGFLKPRRFLPTLEKNGYVVKLDEYMWERACQLLKRWEADGWDDLYISVNISPVDFFFINVLDVFKELIEKYDVSPKKLRLEITENTMMYDAKRRIEVIDSLREAGFIVEMDDFGNGFSSLNMLKDVTIDVMKIDMTFLDETRDISKAKMILQSMISLAKTLEIPVITEGVETAEQLEFLSEMGCDMYQGYYFARAVPIEEFEDRYMRIGGGRIVKEETI